MALLAIVGGAFAGLLTGWWQNGALMLCAQYTAAITQNLLELVSLPVIFLSIVSSLAGMESNRSVALIGRRVLTYTLTTTVIAALVGLVLYFFINPASGIIISSTSSAAAFSGASYTDFLLAMVPSNVVQTFSGQGSVMAVVFLGLLFGFAILRLEEKDRVLLRDGFSALFNMMIAVTRFILSFMPVAVWAFTAFFAQSICRGEGSLSHVWWYVLTVVLANVVQGFVVLPLLLWFKGLSPRAVFTAFRPALTLAFISKSSNMTLPVTLECAQQRAGVTERVARFCLPLCATINMNGCAAFILITLLFVANASGIVLSFGDIFSWLILATVAAVGNAGVPMGCFFLTSAFLAYFQLPIEMMGIILPVYALIDMVETALNVWSDACVTVVVDRELTAAK